MSTGQTFLTLGAVSLLLYMSVNINRIYLSSVEQSLQIQRETEIISYGQSLSERMYAQSTNYEHLQSGYGHFNDVTSEEHRLQKITETGDTLFATIGLSKEKVLMLNEKGRIATITIFDKSEGKYVQKGQFSAAITPIQTNY